MKRTITLAALAILLLTLVFLLGCASNLKLRSIQLQAADGTTGIVEVKGAGGTLQVQAIGTYSNGLTRDISTNVTYAVSITQVPPSQDAFGAPLPAPPQGLSMDVSGLATATAPFVCTFDVNDAITGSYTVTASLNGITSQPLYIPVASSVGVGANGACGP